MGVLTDIFDPAGGLSKLMDRKKKRGSGANPTNDSGTSGEVQDMYHKGGRVKRTGPARLRKGEVVLTSRQARRRGIRGKRR